MTPRATLTTTQYHRLALLTIAAAIVLAVGLVAAPLRSWSNLLVIGYYLITLALGGTLFIALTYATSAKWNVAFRRVPEAMAGMLPALGLGMLAVLAWNRNLYGWESHAHGGDPGTFWFKEGWCTPSLWMLRAVIYVVVWILFSRALVRFSRRQDQTASITPTLINKRVSGLFLVVYAITFSLASCDWFMLLEPMWFSTIWGVYHFAGMLQAALAAMILAAIFLRKRGPLRGVFTTDHMHDLAKLLLAFSCFWMYIWFSQYMLIWYTNIPEETSYYLLRVQGAWGPLMVMNIVLNWIAPFLILLPRLNKRSESVLIKVAIVVLMGRWLDLYLVVFPSTLKGTPVFGLWEIAGMVLLVGAFGWLFFRSFGKASPVPTGDPLLADSLHHHC